MRQVRARLLKLNGLLGNDEDSDQDQPPKIEEKKPDVPPPPPQMNTAPIIKKPPGKRQSKWGKTSSNEPAILPEQTEPVVETLELKPE